MEYTRLGSTGVTVSRICLGMMTYGDKSSARVGAQRAGVAAASSRRLSILASRSSTPPTSIPTASARRSPARALKDFGPGRATAMFWPPRSTAPWATVPTMRGLSRKHIMQGIDASLTPPRHGLCRPLPDPPVRPEHADRGDARGAQRRGARPARRSTSAPRRCSRGSSPRCWRSPTVSASAASSPCRTTTTSSIARRSAR